MENRDRIAIDTNLLIRQAVRRMLTGAADAYGWRVYIPARVTQEAKMRVGNVYLKQEGRRARTHARTVFADPETEEARQWRDRAVEQWTARRVAGFGQWLDTEAERNDTVLEFGQESREAERLARDLMIETDLTDWGDAVWIAQAIRDRVPVVTTDNRKSIPYEEVEAVVASAGIARPREGRWILTPDEAIQGMVEGHEHGYSQWTVAATAYAVGHKERTGPAVEEADRLLLFARALGGAGARMTARQITNAVEDAGDKAKAILRLTELAPEAPRARSSQDRLLKLEAGQGTGRAQAPAASTGWEM